MPVLIARQTVGLHADFFDIRIFEEEKSNIEIMEQFLILHSREISNKMRKENDGFIFWMLLMDIAVQEYVTDLYFSEHFPSFPIFSKIKWKN